MVDSSSSPTTQQGPPQVPELPEEPQPSQQPEESAAPFRWQTIDEQKDFCDEWDCLHPSDLTNEKLQNSDNDIVVYDYSLDLDYLSRANGDHPSEGGSPSSVRPSSGSDRLLRVPTSELTSQREFDLRIKPQLVLSPEPRLGIM